MKPGEPRVRGWTDKRTLIFSNAVPTAGAMSLSLASWIEATSEADTWPVRNANFMRLVCTSTTSFWVTPPRSLYSQEILQKLQLPREKLKEFHKKLKYYRYCSDMNDLQDGFFIHSNINHKCWVILKILTYIRFPICRKRLKIIKIDEIFF